MSGGRCPSCAPRHMAAPTIEFLQAKLAAGQGIAHDLMRLGTASLPRDERGIEKLGRATDHMTTRLCPAHSGGVRHIGENHAGIMAGNKGAAVDLCPTLGPDRSHSLPDRNVREIAIFHRPALRSIAATAADTELNTTGRRHPGISSAARGSPSGRQASDRRIRRGIRPTLRTQLGRPRSFKLGIGYSPYASRDYR
ncbi:hypothetical protein GDI3597 [Gluconacetobacter diazotrophicus PA1 5]|uniref:Uncharacterized protein n=1 Tax=Gluconacetobacter diazotrophicus (strain ATCC 49037 / DSM 5601 / CCUG 37298 / CIP 103539 / LMG 7603 / PAl5) TaxID=272568 RepID=A9H6S4_GLUDA|nr:hypothetical protein GDI3597 [Gluconacetobacter diazotrophicus PA1 5]